MLKDLIWRLSGRLGLRPGDERIFALDEQLATYVYALAEYERRQPDQVVNELLASGLVQRDMADEAWQRWLSLSPREQQVAALVCLDYTNRQVAARLVISPETVKVHVRNALAKYGLRSRNELRMMLAEWDFSAWER